MTSQILAIIGSVLAIVIGFWKFWQGKKVEQEKKAQEARDKLAQAQKDKDKSGELDAWNQLNGMR